MVKDLDITLKDFLLGEAETGSELESAQISFAVPDESWQSAGMGLVLNIYLYNIKVNWKLHSNRIDRNYNNDGTVDLKKAPPRVDCTFLITAWDKATEATDEEKVQQEHRLLSQVMEILLGHHVIPADYLRGKLKGQKPDLPVQLLQQDEMNNMVEFWSALNSPLRPFINCQITMSLEPEPGNRQVPVVLAKTTTTRFSDGEPEEVWVQVGGRVTDNADPTRGIDGAVVSIRETTRQTVTDSLGYFTFYRLIPGSYVFAVSAKGFVTNTLPCNVPPAAGERYEINLTAV